MRSIGLGTMVYGVGQVCARAVGLLTIALLTRFLEAEEFGMIALLTWLALIARSVFGLGLGVTNGILYFQQSDATLRATAMWTAIMVALCSSAVLVVVGALSSGFLAQIILSDRALWGLIVVQLAIVGGQIVSDLFLQHLQYQSRAWEFISVSLGGAVVGAASTIYFVAVLKLGVTGWLLAGGLGVAMSCILAFWRGRPRSRPAFAPDIARELLKLGLPLIPSGLFVYTITHSGAYFLNLWGSLSEAGVFGLGIQLGTAMALATGAFGAAWYPFFQGFVRNVADASFVFPRVANAYLSVFGILTFLFFALAQPLVEIIFDGKYSNSYRIIGLIAASQYVIGFWGMLLPGVYFAKDVRWVSLLQAIAAAGTVGVHAIAIPVFGAEGAALATLFGASLLVVVQCLLNRLRAYDVKTVQWRQASFILAATGLACAAQRLIDIEIAGWQSVLCSLALLAGLSLIGWKFAFKDGDISLRGLARA